MKHIVVRGREHEWTVFVGDAQGEALRQDGIEVMDVVNTVPEWAAMLGLARIWCLAQDVWNLPSRIK